MDTGMLADLDRRTDQLREEGLFKSERVIASPQDAHITLEDGREVLNFCANNYLASPTIPPWWRPPGRPSTSTATGWPRCASSAGPRICTSARGGSPSSSA
jgi:hypothetical protein